MTTPAFRWAFCDADGSIRLSPVFDNFGDCYDDYVVSMTDYMPYRLAAAQWRGVYSVEQIAHILVHGDLNGAPSLPLE